MQESKVVIEGVGKDAEIEVNEKGGKGSKTPAALHLIDPEFLKYSIENEEIIRGNGGFESNRIYKAVKSIAMYMSTLNIVYLNSATYTLENNVSYRLIAIGKTLQEGAKKYEINNWRLVPREIHINHALIHLLAALAGDTQDDHKEHALCRLMMAIATTESPNFSYTEYIKA